MIRPNPPLTIKTLLAQTEINNRVCDLHRRSATIEPLSGHVNRERAFVNLLGRSTGYARETARSFETCLDLVQEHLERLELGGGPYSVKAGQAMLYGSKPRHTHSLANFPTCC
jgi:hypothetical protein